LPKTPASAANAEPANLRRDKWLRNKIASDKDRWVLVSDLMTFNKLKALTTDKNVIVAAIKHADKLLEVSADETKLRRRAEALPKPDDGVDVSIYTEGWPLTFKLQDVQQALTAAGFKPLFIKLRKTGPELKDFAGAAFIEFESAAEVQAAVEGQSKIAVEGVRMEPLATWMERSPAKSAAAPAPAAPPKPPLPLGCIVHFEDVTQPGDRNAMREALKSIAAEGGDDGIAYVDHTADDKSFKVRFRTPELAQRVLAKLPELKDIAAGKASMLEGEVEKEYLAEAQRRIAAGASASSKPSRGGRGGGGGNKRGPGGGRGGREGGDRKRARGGSA